MPDIPSRPMMSSTALHTDYIKLTTYVQRNGLRNNCYLGLILCFYGSSGGQKDQGTAEI